MRCTNPLRLLYSVQRDFPFCIFDPYTSFGRWAEQMPFSFSFYGLRKSLSGRLSDLLRVIPLRGVGAGPRAEVFRLLV